MHEYTLTVGTTPLSPINTQRHRDSENVPHLHYLESNGLNGISDERVLLLLRMVPTCSDVEHVEGLFFRACLGLVFMLVMSGTTLELERLKHERSPSLSQSLCSCFHAWRETVGESTPRARNRCAVQTAAVAN